MSINVRGFCISSAFGAIISLLATSLNCACAQIIQDTTLPNNSNVKLEGKTFNITGGTSQGSNLFHSFQEFSVPTGETALFSNGSNVLNILARVTGKNVSNIDGLIQAKGGANLFLINPNGIIFGQNARLDIGGSFLASTATSFKFGDGAEFSTQPSQQAPLLSILTPMGLQFGSAPANIVNQARGNSNSNGLEVKPGKSLALIGGNIKLDGGILQAPNGHIQLGGYAENGTVGLIVDNNKFDFNFVEGIVRSDISLVNKAKVEVTDKGAGRITVNTRNLNVSDNSQINAGVAKNVTAVSAPGDINIRATGKIEVTQKSEIANTLNRDSKGIAGNVNINTNVLEVKSGIIRTRTQGQGNAGDINIKARDIYIQNPEYKMPGNNIELSDNPALDASNYKNDSANNQGAGFGRSGNISLFADGNITLIGEGKIRENKVISTYSRFGGTGGGNISLVANDSISLTNAYVSSPAFDGYGGKVFVSGKNSVSILDNSLFRSGSTRGSAGSITVESSGSILFRQSELNAGIAGTGNVPNKMGGDIKVSGKSVSVLNGSLLSNSIGEGSGNSGNIDVNAIEKLEIKGGILRTRTLGKGNAGNINIKAGEIYIDNPQYVSPGRNSSLEDKPALDAGNYKHDSQKGFGEGKSGNISLVADRDITLIGRGRDVENKVISTYSRLGGKGGGNISLNANGSVHMSNAYISSPSFEGDRGDISIFGRESISIVDNSLLRSGTNASRAGDINIKSLGPISIIASFLDSSGGSEQTRGGDINISGKNISITGGSEITANIDSTGISEKSGQSGNILIEAGNKFELSGEMRKLSFTPRGERLGNSTIKTDVQTRQSSKTRQGNITINAPQIVIRDRGNITVNTTVSGNTGNINLNAQSILLDNKAALNANTNSSALNVKQEQATINLNTRSLLLRNNSSITTEAKGNNIIGGNININSTIIGSFENSKISANSTDSRGGNIRIVTQGLFINPDSSITATGANETLSGNIEISNTLDPSRGLVELPENLVDAQSQISQTCTPGSRQRGSSFVITGRGGMQPSPTEPLQNWDTPARWVKLEAKPEYASWETIPTTQVSAAPIVEASGWVLTKTGEIILVSQANNVNPYSSWQKHTPCH